MLINKTAYPLTLMLVAAMLCLPAVPMADDKTGEDNTTLQLGKVEVVGHKAILETLQAIKISLRQPYSNDPKLADVIVCRIDDVAGSNAKKWLTCGTNRNLNKNRNTLHGTMQAVATSNSPPNNGSGNSTACTSQDCYNAVVGAISTVLDNEPAKYLHVQVNGAAFHELLAKLPEPAPDAITTLAPEPATSVAPAAVTAQ
jgi:hypothetical protein